MADKKTKAKARKWVKPYYRKVKGKKKLIKGYWKTK